jgi:hypothetical protein
MMFFENNNPVNNNKFIANSFDQKQIGAIDPNCDVIAVIEDAFNNAKFLCDQYYLCSPDFELVTRNGNYIQLIFFQKNFYLKLKDSCLVGNLCTLNSKYLSLDLS